MFINLERAIRPMKTIRTLIHKSFRLFGLDLIRYTPPQEVFPPDFDSEVADIVRAARPWTMTTPERIYCLIQAVRYIQAHAIPGAIVECGVWKGGSMAAAARALLQLRDRSRDLYLFDTFEGMTEPTAKDVEYSGRYASQVLREEEGMRCANAPLETVNQVL